MNSIPTRASESGHTITEAVVALSLLLTVLVPATASVAYLVASDRSSVVSEALGVAQAAMEETLSHPQLIETGWTRDGERWRVQVTAQSDGPLVTLTASATRPGKAEPVVSLTTLRLRP
jgi:hypothetical protein